MNRVELLDADDMMELLNISRSGLYKMVADGRLPKGVRIGTKVKWFRESVEKALTDMRTKAEANLVANRPPANRARYKRYA